MLHSVCEGVGNKCLRKYIFNHVEELWNCLYKFPLQYRCCLWFFIILTIVNSCSVSCNEPKSSNLSHFHVIQIGRFICANEKHLLMVVGFHIWIDRHVVIIIVPAGWCGPKINYFYVSCPRYNNDGWKNDTSIKDCKFH